MKDNYAVIMAGGVGSRFWPSSTMKLPKQFLDILGLGETLLQQTFRRMLNICPADQIMLVTNHNYQDLCKKQIPNIPEENIICEPVSRNTAACIAYASFKINSLNEQANIVVVPSDHLITRQDEFVKIVKQCLDISSSSEFLITLGIPPNRPETGYGYIESSKKTFNNNENIRLVNRFIEKPDEKTAQSLLEYNHFLWNSGIFIWSSKVILQSFKDCLPSMYDIFRSGSHIYNTDQEKSFINEIFPSLDNISIDYGVMENSENVLVYLASFGWSDLGTWKSVGENSDLDEKDNAVLGRKKNVILYESHGNIIKVSDDKVCVVQGVNNLLVIETERAILICDKDQEQRIKEFVEDVRFGIGDEYV